MSRGLWGISVLLVGCDHRVIDFDFEGVRSDLSVKFHEPSSAVRKYRVKQKYQ